MSTKGEFGFIEYIKEHFGVSEGMVGIGDDCAILPCGEGELIYSTDMLSASMLLIRDISLSYMSMVLPLYICRLAS